MDRTRQIASDAVSPEAQLPRRAFATVCLLSVGVLMLQIVLSRIFSFTIWYHFAYVSISLALLGFGSSGAALTAFPSLGRAGRLDLAFYSLLAAVSTVGMLVVIGTVQVNPFEVLSDPRELAKLIVLLLVVTIPFFWIGLAISIASKVLLENVSRAEEPRKTSTPSSKL